jgi:Skp family chaperone for outer membrane proteins
MMWCIGCIATSMRQNACMQPLRVLVFAVMTCAATTSWADGTTHVAVIDSARFYAPGGIARWLAAQSQLDVERKKFVVVESPDGKTMEKEAFEVCKNPPSEEFKKICREMNEATRQHQEDEAWSKHEREVLEPIEADVQRALERYARAHSIDLVLDRHIIPEAFVVVAASADITAAFVKDYNATSKVKPSTK